MNCCLLSHPCFFVFFLFFLLDFLFFPSLFFLLVVFLVFPFDGDTTIVIDVLVIVEFVEGGSHFVGADHGIAA